METIFLKSQQRFGFGVDVWRDKAAWEIDILLGVYTLTVIIDR